MPAVRLSTPDTDPPNEIEQQALEPRTVPWYLRMETQPHTPGNMSYSLTITPTMLQDMCPCCLCRGIVCDGNHPGHNHRLVHFSRLFDPERW